MMNCRRQRTNGAWVRASLGAMMHLRSLLDLDHQPNAYMIAACNRILQPMFHQTESLSLEKKSDIHEHVLQAFLHAWTTVLLEKKYRFW